MGFLGKISSSLFGGAAARKAPKLGTSGDAADQKAAQQAAEDRRREEMGDYLETTQHKGRAIIQEKRGTSYGNVNPMGRGEAPELEAFMYGERFDRFASSNVEAIQYDITTSQLYVRYQGGRWYRYDGVTKTEAQQFWAGYSKGTMVWDILRVRGTKDGHRKSFTRDAAPPDYLPLQRTLPLEAFGSQDVLREVARRPV